MKAKEIFIKKNVILFLIAGIVGCTFGSFAGVYAWFEYSARATTTYSGTAISESEEMSIGLVSNTSIPGFASKYQLYEDTTSLPGSYIYWSPSASLKSEAIKEYENFYGYASDEMYATSSGSFKDGDAFALKRAPRYLEKAEAEPAEKEGYSFLKLAFKSDKSNLNFFLKSANVECPNDIRKAVRIHFANPNDSSMSFIYNPSAEMQGGTAVGGILNLNCTSDDRFDFNYGTDYEKIYGEVENVTYSGERYNGDKPVPQEDVTCFTSNHQKGLFVPTISPKYAQYSGFEVLNSRPITYTPATSSVAILDATIYMEGWDHACTDKGLFHSYNLDLKFTFGNRG